MAFKYLNPGYAELLDVTGGTTIADTGKSKTGVAFYQPTAKKVTGVQTCALPI